MFALLLLLPLLFYSANSDFFDQVSKERAEGAEWHYVGPKELDPAAKSLHLQCYDEENNEYCGDPYVLWKLKKDK